MPLPLAWLRTPAPPRPYPALANCVPPLAQKGRGGGRPEARRHRRIHLFPLSPGRGYSELRRPAPRGSRLRLSVSSARTRSRVHRARRGRGVAGGGGGVWRAVRRRAAGTNGGAGAGGKSSVRRAREGKGTRRKRSWRSGAGASRARCGGRAPGTVAERCDPGEGRGGGGGAWGRERAPGTSSAGRWGCWGGSRGRASGGEGKGRGRGVPAVPRPCLRVLLRPEGPQGPHRRDLGGGLFPLSSCPQVREPSSTLPSVAVDPAPTTPFRLSVSGPPFRLGVCQPLTGFPPVGLRSTPPPGSARLSQAHSLLSSALLFFLFRDPPPHTPSSFHGP